MQNTNQLIGDLGQHWTPENIVNLMLELKANNGSILEPSAGSGRFMRALPDAVGVEIDEKVVPADLKHRYQIKSFFDFAPQYTFDTIIGNPPYVNGKLLTTEWFGNWKPNLPITANAYLHFIDKCLELMHDGSELIFIVPKSLLSETSKGKILRQKMCQTGAFTHLFFAEDLVKWDAAAIETVIFRWVKGHKQTVVITNRGEKTLVENDGFVWLLNFTPYGVIGDFFNVTVGAAPPSSAINVVSTCSDYYIRYGEPVLVDETNYKSWPRPRFTNNDHKIYYIAGPTRKHNKFFSGFSGKHIDNVLLPLKKLDCVKAATALNGWFANRGIELGLVVNGRWNVGVSQLKNCPIDKELFDILTRLIL